MHVCTDRHIGKIPKSIPIDMHPIWHISTNRLLITGIRRTKVKSWFYHFKFVILGKSLSRSLKMILLLKEKIILLYILHKVVRHFKDIMCMK